MYLYVTVLDTSKFYTERITIRYASLSALAEEIEVDYKYLFNRLCNAYESGVSAVIVDNIFMIRWERSKNDVNIRNYVPATYGRGMVNPVVHNKL